MKSRIPVYFSTNSKYVPYLGVTLYSLMVNSSDEYVYDVKILFSELDKNEVAKLERLSCTKINVECIDVSAYLQDKNYYDGPASYTKHISKETFYRLLIPEMFSEEKKILYLDCDLVVLGDVSELYHSNLNGKTIGAVYSVEHWSENGNPVVPNSDEHEWFNAGVMIVDVQSYIAKGYIERCKEEMKTKTFNVVDQDLLRLVCYGDTCYLPYEWNFMWHHIHNGGNGLKEHNREIYNLVKKHPKIIHYTSGLKPWSMPDKDMSQYFWKYARETDFYEEILYSNIQVEKQGIDFSKYIFPFDLIARGTNVVLYGAGNVGKTLKQQNDLVKWCNIIAWADKKFDDDSMKRFELIPPNIISKLPAEHILIAVENESTAEAIMAELEDIGASKEKMIWANYLV